MKSVRNQIGVSYFNIIENVIFSYQKLIFDTEYIFLPSDIIWPVEENKQGRTFFSAIGLFFPRS